MMAFIVLLIKEKTWGFSSNCGARAFQFYVKNVHCESQAHNSGMAWKKK